MEKTFSTSTHGLMTMRLLAIETTSPRLSLAVGDHHKILASYRSPLQWRHAESLFAGLKKVLAKVGWKPSQLTGVAVAVGPGSFTGIRIGLAAARALGQTLNVPVVGVSSLEVMAQGASTNKKKSSKEKRPAARFSPEVDAFSGKLFTAIFDRTAGGALKRFIPESCVNLDEWTRRLQTLPGPAIERITTPPDAVDLLTLARPRLAHAKAASYLRVFPLYLRQAAAQERRKA